MEVSSHELQVRNASTPNIILRIKLPHQDFETEAVASWPGAKQRFRARGSPGEVEESYQWADEEDELQWTVDWDTWLKGWLTQYRCAHSGSARVHGGSVNSPGSEVRPSACGPIYSGSSSAPNASTIRFLSH